METAGAVYLETGDISFATKISLTIIGSFIILLVIVELKHRRTNDNIDLNLDLYIWQSNLKLRLVSYIILYSY